MASNCAYAGRLIPRRSARAEQVGLTSSILFFTADGDFLRRLELTERDSPTVAALSPDGTMLAVGHDTEESGAGLVVVNLVSPAK